MWIPLVKLQKGKRNRRWIERKRQVDIAEWYAAWMILTNKGLPIYSEHQGNKTRIKTEEVVFQRPLTMIHNASRIIQKAIGSRIAEGRMSRKRVVFANGQEWKWWTRLLQKVNSRHMRWCFQKQGSFIHLIIPLLFLLLSNELHRHTQVMDRSKRTHATTTNTTFYRYQQGGGWPWHYPTTTCWGRWAGDGETREISTTIRNRWDFLFMQHHFYIKQISFASIECHFYLFLGFPSLH